MPSARVWSGLIVLVLVSVLGSYWCRNAASAGGNQERLLQLAGEAVHRLPDAFGPWRSVSSDPLTADVLAMLQCRDHESRSYANTETGERVSLILLAGKAGPMVSHTPEVCYESAAFEVVAPARPEEIRQSGQTSDVFDRVIFRSNSVAGEMQAVHYAWRRAEGSWQAPRNPRMTLGGAPILYKLQLATVAELEADEERTPTVGQRFLEELLPALDPLLSVR